MPKTAISRIPTRCSSRSSTQLAFSPPISQRNNYLLTFSPVSPPSPSSVSSPSHIDPSHLGRLVKIVDKPHIGTLRYIGPVNFCAQKSPYDLWCGIEFETAVGKNDGTVNGFRYFTCAPFCGLMTPVHKVQLVMQSNSALKNKKNSASSVCGDSSYDEISDFCTRSVPISSHGLSDYGLGKGSSPNDKQRSIVSNLSQAKRGKSDVSMNLSTVNDFIVFQSTPQSESTPYLTDKQPHYSQRIEQCPSNRTSFGLRFKGAVFEADSFAQTDSTMVITAIEMEPTLTNEDEQKSDLPSPNCTTSFGLIDDRLLENLTTCAPLNMTLPLNDGYGVLMEDTPSPEDLPLDPIPLICCSSASGPLSSTNDTAISLAESVSRTTSVQQSGPTTSSSGFATSITSITSVDTGYQGDGENSRPASRGSNLTLLQQHQQRQLVAASRRIAVEEDSDFYTESDADENVVGAHNGRRVVHLIDGALYGASLEDRADATRLDVGSAERMPALISGVPVPPASIILHTRSELIDDNVMESSGVFTDFESRGTTNTTPNSETSTTTKTATPASASSISVNSQEMLVTKPKSSTHSPKSSTQSAAERALKCTPQNSRMSSIGGGSAPEAARGQLSHGTGKKMAPVAKMNTTIVLRNGSSGRMKSTRSSSTMDRKALEQRNAGKSNTLASTLAPRSHSTLLQRPPADSSSSKRNILLNKSPSSNTLLGRWDPIMNKISKWPDTKPNFKDVKSKVNSLVSTNRTPSHGAHSNVEQARCRRSNTRIYSSNRSANSSLSDISAKTPPMMNASNTKGPFSRSGSLRITKESHTTHAFLTPKASPRPNHVTSENLKNGGPKSCINKSDSTNNKSFKKSLFSNKDNKKQSSPSLKDTSRASVRNGRTSPAIRNPTPNSTTIPYKNKPSAKSASPKVVEALAILVQHLVFNVEAYQVPVLRRQMLRARAELEQMRISYQHLEQLLSSEETKHAHIVHQLQADHSAQLEHLETELQTLHEQYKQHESDLTEQHKAKMLHDQEQYEQLQSICQSRLEIMREENEEIQQKVDEKKETIRRLEVAVEQARRDNDAKIKDLQKTNTKLKEDMTRYRNDYERLLHATPNGISLQEVESLRTVLDLKNNEVSDLRRQLAEAQRRVESLEGVEDRAQIFATRCEDLKLQLQRKLEVEQHLSNENKRLEECIRDEEKQKTRLSRQNEELQWKLRQNKEIVSKVIEGVTSSNASSEHDFHLSRSSFCTSTPHSSGSFNDHHIRTLNMSGGRNLERAQSFREFTPTKRVTTQLADSSTPIMVKGIVQKSDSVSYVLDLEEAPDVIASRIVRRSFRKSPNPKNVTSHSPINKRPKIKMNSNCSDQSNCLLIADDSTFDDYQDQDLKLLALPSAIITPNGSAPKLLPPPKHLAVSESNSDEDEDNSCSSGSSGSSHSSSSSNCHVSS